MDWGIYIFVFEISQNFQLTQGSLGVESVLECTLDLLDSNHLLFGVFGLEILAGNHNAISATPDLASLKSCLRYYVGLYRFSMMNSVSSTL